MKSNQLGVTLLELVMSLAIMSGIGYMIMHQQEMASKAQGKSGIDLEITNLGTHIRDALSDVPSCSQTLRNIVPGTVSAGLITGGDIPVIFRGIGNDRVANKNLLVTANEAGKGILVKQMQLFSENEQDMIRVTFEASERAKKVITGGSTIAKDYFIVGTKDPMNKSFLECGAVGLNANDEDVCATIENGTWDPVAGTCALKDFLKKSDGLTPVYVDGAGFKITNVTATSTLSCVCNNSDCADAPNCSCNAGACAAGEEKENPIRRVTVTVGFGKECHLEAICYRHTPVINETPIGMLVQP